MAKRTGGFIGQDGINAPDPATGVTGTAGDQQVEVSWTAPSDVGGAAITGYSVQAADGSGTWQSSFDLSGASYDNKNFDVSGEETNPSSLFLKSDGTKMYVTGPAGDDVNEYALSTAWDVTTASYTTAFDVSANVLNPEGIYFKSDGTKMYVWGVSSSVIGEYDLSTAWDVSTASLNDTATFTSQVPINNGQDITLNGDGTKLYIIGGSSTIYQYSLSTAYDITTASYDSVSLDVSTNSSSPADLTFNSDGTRLYVVAFGSDTVAEYALTTAYDLSTASYNNASFDISGQMGTSQGLYFKSDGVKMYVVGQTADAVYQYSTGQVDYPTSSPVTITGLSNGTSYTFNVWAINPFGWSSPSDASGGVSPAAALALFMGGENASGTRVNSIDKVNISSTGNATDYGDLSTVVSGASGIGSLTRAVRASGYTGAYVNTIEFKLFSSSGNMSDFGDLVNGYTSFRGAGLGSATRGLISGGLDSGVAVNVIQYITIASEGNATDFGDMTSTEREHGACSSSTRGIMAGGDSNGNVIQYVTIASTGNATDFGDLTTSRGALCGCSSSTRGVFAGGSSSNVIDYITIASTGNATDFGDLAAAVNYPMGASSSTRGLFAGGVEDSRSDRIQYVTIASTGNSTDFGDLTIPREQGAGTSNAHGGLS
jgi:hypothetical protein